MDKDEKQLIEVIITMLPIVTFLFLVMFTHKLDWLMGEKKDKSNEHI